MLSPTASDATIEASAETRVVSAGKKRPASLAAGTSPIFTAKNDGGSGFAKTRAEAGAEARWKKQRSRVSGAAATSSEWKGLGVLQGRGTKTSALQSAKSEPGGDTSDTKGPQPALKVVDRRVRFHARLTPRAPALAALGTLPPAPWRLSTGNGERRAV